MVSDAVAYIVRNYLTESNTVVDIGASTGNMIDKLMPLLLERKAYENKRLLGSFNEECDNWLDFFAFTDFVDRDGKFQLQMLKYSAFAPLGRSMSYMLREEAFHMGCGNDGLARIVKAGETFFVPEGLVHDGINTGSGKAKVLATYVVEKGKPVATPAK